MSRCLLTGATGFLGSHLTECLLEAGHSVTLLVRNTHAKRIKIWQDRWNAQAGAEQVSVIKFDLASEGLGLDAEIEWSAFDHVYHLAAIYDLNARPSDVLTTNVEGTRCFMEMLTRSDFRGHLHFVSSIAVAGNYQGVFNESMFDERQTHPHVYHQSKFESEALVRTLRERARFNILIYRPSAIAGHSESGYIDKIDGPYYLFNLVSQLKRWIPPVAILPVLKTRTALDMVPVDYVARAIMEISQNHAGHLPESIFCFHLTNPDSPSLSELYLMLMNCADGPAAGFQIPIDGLTKMGAIKQLNAALQLKAVKIIKKQIFDLLRLPENAFDALMPEVSFNADMTRSLLEKSDIRLPDMAEYIKTLWEYYSIHLDPYKNKDVYARNAFKGKRVLITGGSSGIGLASAKIAYRYGAHVILVARDEAKLRAAQAEIIDNINEVGRITVLSCDISDLSACDELLSQLKDTLGGVDIFFSNAGRSIRRSVSQSEGRFHDLERTMQLNYFGAARLILGMIPMMRQQGGGHIIHSSSMGTLSATPRFGPYMASKVALDTLLDAMAAEFANQNIHFSCIKFPLVKTPMVAPTAAFKKARLTSPEQAATIFMETVIDKTRHKLTATGSLLGFIAWLSPNFMTQLYNYGFQVWPDEPADFPEMALDRMLMKYFIPNSPL